jgi:DNA-binding transcriptional LysR family regulator
MIAIAAPDGAVETWAATGAGGATVDITPVDETEPIVSTCRSWTHRSLILNNGRVETRRLQLLHELARLGSMRDVADALGVTTSTVSQQIAALAREVGTALIEPDGRRVRLTPAGRRLAEHAVTILAAVEMARIDLDPGAEPSGTLQVAGFASAIRRTLLPLLAGLAVSHPRIRLLIHEHEPAEAFALLDRDAVDLALTYDYTLAPRATDPGRESTPLWFSAWGLGVPDTGSSSVISFSSSPGASSVIGSALEVFDRFRTADWVVNSRNTADEEVIRTIASMAGFEPRIAHRVDTLALVQDLITAGLGVGLLPADQPTRPGVRLLPLLDPQLDPVVVLRARAVTRRGRADWPPLALVLGLLRASSQAAGRPDPAVQAK